MKCFCVCILVFFFIFTCESFGVLNLFSSNKQLVLTDQKSNFQDAQKYCKDLGGFLPTDDEVKAQTSQSNQSGDYWVSWQIKTDVSGSTHKYLGRKTDAKAWSMHHECWTVCCIHKGTVDGKGFQVHCLHTFNLYNYFSILIDNVLIILFSFSRQTVMQNFPLCVHSTQFIKLK